MVQPRAEKLRIFNELFCFILIFHNPTNARELYDKYKLYFINQKIHEIISERNALKLINNTLSLHGFSLQDFRLLDSFRPNPSQIRWSAYAYITDHFGIKVFMFFSKNYLTRIFLFFCFIKISCVQRY